METFPHDFKNLMSQLGFLGEEAINSFLENHKDLPYDILLENAPFWSDSQATFLCEKMLNDSEWGRSH